MKGEIPTALKDFIKDLPVIRQVLQLRDTITAIQRSTIETKKKVEDLAKNIEQLRILGSHVGAVFFNDYSQGPKDLRNLNCFEFSVFSQNGEDGIIHEIFSRIGAATKIFLEVGVGDGLENNTSFLLQDDWRGLWIDASKDHVSRIKEHFREEIIDNRLKIVHSMVTLENALEIVNRNLNGDLDLLSIDIDRNTYWISKALLSLYPRVVVVEYNATYPPDFEWVAPYDSAKFWNGSMHFGASLKAYEKLMGESGYNLVACDITGTNAFFVRSDLCGKSFTEPFTAELHYKPPRYFLSMRAAHPRAFKD